MASRASIAAGGILLISLVVVFALVANNGVSTGVYLPDQPTHTRPQQRVPARRRSPIPPLKTGRRARPAG